MRIAHVLTRLINIVVGIVEIFLGVRFVLRLFGANQTSEFVAWWYDTSAPLLEPFEGAFPTVVEEGLVIEFSTLFAILIYALVAWLLTELVYFVAEAGRTAKHKKHREE